MTPAPLRAVHHAFIRLGPSAVDPPGLRVREAERAQVVEAYKDRVGDLVKMSILVNAEPVDALSMIVNRQRAEMRGRGDLALGQVAGWP